MSKSTIRTSFLKFADRSVHVPRMLYVSLLEQVFVDHAFHDVIVWELWGLAQSHQATYARDWTDSRTSSLPHKT